MKRCVDDRDIWAIGGDLVCGNSAWYVASGLAGEAEETMSEVGAVLFVLAPVVTGVLAFVVDAWLHHRMRSRLAGFPPRLSRQRGGPNGPCGRL